MQELRFKAALEALDQGADMLVVSCDYDFGAPAALAAEKVQKDPATTSRVLVINGSARNDGTCPGEISKSYRMTQLAREVLEKPVRLPELSRALRAALSGAQEPADDVYWEATMHATKGPTLRVNASGNCFIERISVDVENVVKLIQIAR